MAAAEHRILVVDDEKSITDLVTMALHLHGVTTEVAHTGTDALRLVRTFRPHLVVLDVMLPDLDGFAVLERMGQERDTVDIPVLFLTARGDLDDRLRGLSLGGRRLHDQAVQRRGDAAADQRHPAPDRGVRRAPAPGWSVGDLELDEESHQVWRAKCSSSSRPPSSGCSTT